MKKGLLLLLTICLVLMVSTSAMAASWDDNPFSDVADPPNQEWYYGAVWYVYSAEPVQIMVGMTPTTFVPNGPVTRGQLPTILYRIEVEPSGVAASPFRDLTADWYRNAINWAYAEDIVYGYNSTIYGPNDVCTREQFVTILYRYAIFDGADVSTDPTAQDLLDAFDDAGEVSDWALDAVLWALEDGYIEGYGGGVLNPKGTITRAEAATIVAAYLEPAPF